MSILHDLMIKQYERCDSGIRLNDEGSSCCVITIYCLLASVINNLTVACRSLWLGSACKMGHSMK